MGDTPPYGRAFRTTVEVDPGQAVVTTGPYRWIRHPSYSGLLLIVGRPGPSPSATGCRWSRCCVVPLPAIVRRIHVEEAELERVLGDAYLGYQRTTARLVPRLW